MSKPRHFSIVFNSALELHLAPKTTIIPVSVRHDNKSHKKTAPHPKERKGKRPKDRRRGEEEDASGEDEENSEPLTTGSWLEPRTVQTIMPSASHPPSWIPHRNDIDNSPAGSPSCDCHIGSARLPLWATAFIVHVALRNLLNIHYVIIF